MMKRRRFKQTTTLEDRLADMSRRAREDVETLAPGKERDGLIEKIREIEATLELGQFLRSQNQSRM
jgi:hypothetical protein